MTILSLWMPIVASAVIVWIASAVVWMVLPWHKSDWRPVPDEEATHSALTGIAPGTLQRHYQRTTNRSENYVSPRLLSKNKLGKN